MKLLIVTTGGTIEGLEYNDESLRSQQIGIRIDELLMKTRTKVSYSIESIFSKDSRFITNHDRELLLNVVASSGESHILITHGTYTMVDTAKYLGKENLGKTIILTGSFILGTEKNSDASANLSFAISQFGKIPTGVYVAMHETVFDWNNVKKNKENKKFEVISVQ